MKIAIATLGCKTNQYESELIRESFAKTQDEFVNFKDKADVYVVNSCVVTNKAEAETRKLVNDALRNNPNAKVILTGCFVGIYDNSKQKNVILYSGERKNIAEFFYEKLNFPIDINSEEIEEFSEHTRAVVKIEEGCSNFCTYCIVRFTRGISINSKEAAKIIEEINRLVNNGYKEIVLTGTEIGKYGEDIGTTLATLLAKLKKVRGLKRLRISSIHPKHVTDSLINEIDYPIVPHLHVSLQSGDNSILRAMNRGYTVEDYIGIAERLRQIDENFSISTDLIVGFPGETEEAFLNSINIVHKMGFSKVHIFRFSKRPFTPAFYFDETVSEVLKKARALHLKKVAFAEQKLYKEHFLNKTVEVLVEGAEEGLLTGFTPYYLKVKFTGSAKTNEFVNVKIENIDANFMYGKEVI